jgi:hypothetical protein
MEECIGLNATVETDLAASKTITIPVRAACVSIPNMVLNRF